MKFHASPLLAFRPSSPVNGRGNIVTTSHKRIPFAFTQEWGLIVMLIAFIVPLPFTGEDGRQARRGRSVSKSRAMLARRAS